jgi:hypothetical protein
MTEIDKACEEIRKTTNDLKESRLKLHDARIKYEFKMSILKQKGSSK